jgi:hypothetical protein
MREENPYALKLDPSSYPDDAPLGTEDGKIFRFNQHRRHTAYDMDMSEVRGKNWTREGQDVSDYFNYGMDEAGWTEYAKEQCKKRNKLNFLMYLDEHNISRPDPEKLKKMKLNTTTSGGGGGGGGSRGRSAARARDGAGAGQQQGRGAPMASSSKSCYKCGNGGHIARDCPETGPGGDIRACYSCGKVGHLSTDCPQQRCYVCNGIGHISTQCPNKRERSRSREKKNM